MSYWLYCIIGFFVVLVGTPLLLLGGVLLMHYLPIQGYLPVGAVLFVLSTAVIDRWNPQRRFNK